MRRCLLVIVVAALASGRITAAPVAPDPAAVRDFAVLLQRDYAQRQSQAIVDRMSEKAVIRRICGNRNPESVMFTSGDWNRFVLPSLKATAAALDSFPSLVFCRFILSHDERQLQCEFLSESGTTTLAVLTLVPSGYGPVHIADIQVAGQPFSFTRMIRQEIILRGGSVPNVVDGQEIELRAYASNHGRVIEQSFQYLIAGRFELAFTEWSKAPENLRQLPIGRQITGILANRGCVRARREIEREIRGGADMPPLMRFDLAMQSKDRPAALAALSAVLREYQDPVLYRCAKAHLLIESGRAMEAYDLYCDIIDLTPYVGLAYVGAIRAAANLNRPILAVAILRRWALLSKPAEMDATLAGVPDTAALRASPQYTTWLNSQPSSVTPKPQ